MAVTSDQQFIEKILNIPDICNYDYTSFA